VQIKANLGHISSQLSYKHTETADMFAQILHLNFYSYMGYNGIKKIKKLLLNLSMLKTRAWCIFTSVLWHGIALSV